MPIITHSRAAGYPLSPKSAAGAILDLFSNVWFGVVLAVLLFFYCSVGSAMHAVRRHPALEMTEFEWFHWWPFNVLIIVFCATLIITTIRRIPLRLTNAGVWTTHSGILMLTLGSYYYFGTKIEGDAPVFRRRVHIELPNPATTGTLPAIPGSETRVVAGTDVWQFRIQNTNSAWPILSEEHKGKTAYAVNVAVTPPSGQPFIRQLLAGYDQYTEDVLPGQGRAVKVTGKKLVNPDLSLTLEYEPQEYFHLMETWALYARKVGDTQWAQRLIRQLPRYHEHIGSRDQVFADADARLPLRAIDLPVPPGASNDVLGAMIPRITGYLPYAHMQRRWREGGERLNPVLQLTVSSPNSADERHELLAFDRKQNQMEDGLVRFVWLEDAAQVETLPADSRPALHVAVPAADVALDVPITQELVVGHEGAFTAIERTDFSYRILAIQDDLMLPGRNKPVSIALVEIQHPEGSFRRWVSDQAELTRDIHGEGTDPHALDSREPDRRIEMTYRPQSAPLIFAGYPGGLTLVFNGPQGRVMNRTLQPGEAVEVMPGLRIRVDALWTRAVAEIKPYVVPEHRRDRDARESFSMIRLELDTGRRVEDRWVPFNKDVLPGEEYAYAGRFPYSPERFRLTDGTMVEIVFSRERRKLPYPIALESFELDTHLGGYSGAMSTIRNYRSQLRFRKEGQWTEPIVLAVNNPAEFGEYRYFQSTWDKPPAQEPSGGMNYTGLGIGNRRGVYVQLAGCAFAVTGMIFTFYVKPVIKRRRGQKRLREDAPGRESRSIPDTRETAPAIV